MSIENPTLDHFRHFSSLFTNLPSTSVEGPLQIGPFMQNKPNFQKSQMNVSILLQMDYENKRNWTLGESKPNSNPIKACPERSEFTLSVIEGNGPISKRMNVNFCAAGYYESKPTFAVRKGRPNNPNVEISTAFSCGARIVAPEG